MTAPGAARPASAEAFGFAYRYEPPVPGQPGADLTVLALHGTGGDEHDLVPLARALAPGAKPPIVTIAAGLMDPLVSREQAERLAELLRQAGADTTLDWLPAGHQLTQRDLAVGLALVARL